MPHPILTLTTDFGLSDHYVGAMKGVILGICPRAQIVDITHDIPPYQISEGAFAIAQAYRCFPKGTVHVVVVDPGVGTARRPILRPEGSHHFPSAGAPLPLRLVSMTAPRPAGPPRASSTRRS